jgi:hypothetical protein
LELSALSESESLSSSFESLDDDELNSPIYFNYCVFVNVSERYQAKKSCRKYLRHREHFETVAAADGDVVVDAAVAVVAAAAAVVVVATVHQMLLASMLKPIECLNYY